MSFVPLVFSGDQPCYKKILYLAVKSLQLIYSVLLLSFTENYDTLMYNV